MRGPFPNIEFYQCVTYGAYTAEWQEKVRFYPASCHICVCQEKFMQICSFVFPLCFPATNNLFDEWEQICGLKIVLIKPVQWFCMSWHYLRKNCKIHQIV